MGRSEIGNIALDQLLIKARDDTCLRDVVFDGLTRSKRSAIGWFRGANTVPSLMGLHQDEASNRLWPFVAIGLFLKGAGMGELWPHAAALAAISAPMFLASWLLFRRQW